MAVARVVAGLGTGATTRWFKAKSSLGGATSLPPEQHQPAPLLELLRSCTASFSPFFLFLLLFFPLHLAHQHFHPID